MKSIRISKVIFLTFIFIQSILHAELPPKAGISPSRFEITYEKKLKTYAFKLINFSDEVINAKVSVSNWTMENTKLKEIEPTPESLDQWMLITPVNFTVEAKSTQTIRFALRPKVKPKPGEYRAVIWLDEQVDSNEAKKSMRAKFRLGVPVYLSVPPIYTKGTLDDFKVKTENDFIKVSLKLKNEGNVHDRLIGDISLWNRASFLNQKQKDKILFNNKEHKDLISKIAIPSKPILPNLKQEFSVSLPKPEKGEYILYMNASFKDKKKINKEEIITIK